MAASEVLKTAWIQGIRGRTRSQPACGSGSNLAATCGWLTIPEGQPQAVFDGLQVQLAANRSEFFRAVASGRFYGFNRSGREPSEAVIENWWRQGMRAANARCDCIDAFAEEDYTEDLEKISVPVLVMHGDDDQIVPYAITAPRTPKLVQNGTLKTTPASRTACRLLRPTRSTPIC